MIRKSTHNRSNRLKALATTAAAIALAVPATASADVDLRNPDNRATGPQGQVDLRNPDTRASEPQGQVDLRSPDSRVESPPAPAADQGYVDLRSPDARAAGQGYVDLRGPDSRDVGRPAETPTAPTQVADTGDFGWGDAAIGAGIAFALLLIGLSGPIAVNRRRHGATA